MIEQTNRGIRGVSRRRLLLIGVVLTGCLLATLAAAALTVPASELRLGVRNDSNVETAHIVFYLDGAEEGGMYIGPDDFGLWKFHVSPGTHSVGIDSSFEYSSELEHDGIIDYQWTTTAGFLDMKELHLRVDTDGVNHDIGDYIYSADSPLKQTLTDPYVMIPTTVLILTSIVATATALCYLRHADND